MSVFSKKKDFYVLYIPGGGIYGVAPTYPMEFLSDLTDQHLTKTFNMFSGASIGSLVATAANVAESKNSDQPRYKPEEFREHLISDVKEVFPQKRLYYLRQMLADSAAILFGFFAEGSESLSKWSDKTLVKGVNATIALYENKVSRNPPGEEDGNTKVNLNFFRRIYGMTLKPVNNAIQNVIEKWQERCHYDITVLEEKVAQRLNYSDDNTSPMLNDTILSHHVVSWNIDDDEPAYFINWKSPNQKKGGNYFHVSDPDLEVVDMVCRSCAAQTVFQPHQGKNGKHYLDVAQSNTPRSVLSEIEGRLNDTDYQVKIVVIETGDSIDKLDAQKLSRAGFLMQLLASHGTALLSVMERFARKTGIKDIERSIGKDNYIVIDKAKTYDRAYQKYHPPFKLRDSIKQFGRQKIRRTKNHDLANIPNGNFFDSSDKHIDQINKFGYAMVWENAVQLINLSKDLLRNGQSYGNITRKDAQEQTAYIERLMDDDYQPPASLPFNEEKYREFEAKIHDKWPFLQDLKDVFKQAQNDNETPLYPLRYGSALSKVEKSGKKARQQQPKLQAS